MLSSARISLCSPTPSIINNLNPNSKLFACSTNSRKSYDNRLVCKAASNSSSSISDFDLYDLLGVDSSSDQADIKLAYRTLQKRCHPDIAGAAGHDMAIVLNEAYALLSDPNTRFLYDKEQSKIEGLRGYTGKPLYSSWFGSESEERAVFVDEVKCVGCQRSIIIEEYGLAIQRKYSCTFFHDTIYDTNWPTEEHKVLVCAINNIQVDTVPPGLPQAYWKNPNILPLNYVTTIQDCQFKVNLEVITTDPDDPDHPDFRLHKRNPPRFYKHLPGLKYSVLVSSGSEEDEDDVEP